jgi:hypothetical protein
LVRNVPRTDLRALPSLGSDHNALSLQGDVNLDFYRGFRFESYWVHMPGFLDTVKESWIKPVNMQDTILRLHVKTLRTAKALKNWRRKSLGGWKVAWGVLTVTLENLEKAQEERPLLAQMMCEDGLMIYFWRSIWKERNRRTFQSKNLQPREVAFLCKEEFDHFQLATRSHVEATQ